MTVTSFRKSEIEEIKDKPTKNMTANERKMKTLFPDKSLADIEKLKKISSSLEEIPEKKCKFKMFIIDMRTKSTKAIRHESMYSNIFHDPNKHKIKEAIYKSQETIVNPVEEKKNPPKDIKKTKTSATFDWKYSNSEVLFKGENEKNE